MAITLVVIVLLASDYLSGGMLRGMVRSGGAAIFQAGDSVASAILESGVFSTRRQLAEQNRILSERMVQLEEKEYLYNALKQENESLKAFLNVSGASATVERGVLAPIVSSRRTSPYGTFLVGVGSADGIIAGSFVLTAEGVVIGIVKDVGGHVSAVAEIFAPGLQEEGIIEGATVLIEGLGGGNGYGKVPRGLDVQVGDAVVSPRLGSRLIGVVGKVASSSAGASQEVFIRIPINFSAQRYVYITTGGN